MSGWYKLLQMGCFCGRESIVISETAYHVKAHIGDGGFSQVDLAWNTATRKLCAIKRIMCYSEEDKRIALKEAEYMRQFNHPNLIPLVGCESIPVKGRRSVMCEVLISMPFYKKGSIQNELEVIAKSGLHMAEARVLRLLRGICEGLRVLHHSEPPLSHRDIKPANVMLDTEDVPILMDFGSMGPGIITIQTPAEARKLQDLAAERCSMPYRAPELFAVDPNCTIDTGVDIWSLGCTLYAMCYGESPFDKVHRRGDSIALAVQTGNVKLPNAGFEYTSDLKELITYMLVVSPGARPDIDSVIRRVDFVTSTQQSDITFNMVSS